MNISTENAPDRPKEYFLLASYSCLPSVITRLEHLREMGQRAVLFCMPQQLYRFLERLSGRYAWIEVCHIDVTDLTTRPLRNPLNWWRVRRDAKALYARWFARIPNGQTIHFYNRFAALFLFYSVWRLKDRHNIHYTASDPAGLHPESCRLSSRLQKVLFRLIYAVPLKIVEPAGRQTKTWPALTDQALADIVDVEHRDAGTAVDLRTSELMQALSWHLPAQVLWLMGLVLDMDEVYPEAYREVLQQCINAVTSVFAPEQQVVKFHPRARQRETGWDPTVEHVPGYVPAEFISLPDLKVVLTISSTAVSTLGASPNTRIISLVEVLPFRDEATRDAHRRLARHFGADTTLLMPASMAELREYLLDTSSDPEGSDLS